MTATLPDFELERAGQERGHYLCDRCHQTIGLKGWVAYDGNVVLIALCKACHGNRAWRRKL